MSSDTNSQNAPPESSSNPFSTGGGGNIFELKVQSGLFTLLLVNAYAPIFEAARISTLHLQTESLGFATDDALIIAIDSHQRRRQQLWSIKREVQFNKSNDVFRDVIVDAWKDYSNPSVFNPKNDVIVLATASISADARHFLTVLEICRASSSWESFQRKVNTKGFVSKKGIKICDVVRGFLDSASQCSISDADFWSFLQIFHVLSFDFDNSASVSESQCKTLLKIALGPTSSKTGSELWNKIFAWVGSTNPRAGEFERNKLPSDWTSETSSVLTHFESGVIHRLLEHSKDLLQRIKATSGPQRKKLPREGLVTQLASRISQERYTLVTGPAGSGKSASSLEAIQSISNGAPVFIFQAAEFAFSSLDHALGQLRITEPLTTISSLFALHPRKFLLVESVERLLEAQDRDAFFSFLSRIEEDPTWRVVLTCRQHAAGMFREAFLHPLHISCFEHEVPLLTVDELQEVLVAHPQLVPLVRNERTQRLLRNLWFLDRACTLNLNDTTTEGELNPTEIKNLLWRQIVSKESERAEGIHLIRERVFENICLRRARSLQSFVKLESGEERAAQLLIRDELLVQEKASGAVAPAHDVLEDWALERWIATQFEKTSQPELFFPSLGHELPIRRAYRKWLEEKLATGDAPQIRAHVEATVKNTNVEPFWRDETAISLLLSDEGSRFIDANHDLLFGDNKFLFYRFSHLLRIAAKKPNPFLPIPERDLAPKFGDYHLVPTGQAWEAMVNAIHSNAPQFAVDEIPKVLAFLEDWKRGLHWRVPLTEAARKVGLVAIHFWNKVDDSHRTEKLLKRLGCIIAAVSKALGQDFVDFIAHTETEPSELSQRGHRYKPEVLEETLLQSIDGWSACRSHPREIARYAATKWGLETEPSSPGLWGAHHLHMDAHFGLTAGRSEFSPPSALQGPFFAILQSDEEVGLNLILKLCNTAADRYSRSGLDDEYGTGPVVREFVVEENVIHKQLGSRRLWMMFREGMPGPEVLQSALMALEKWLLDACKRGTDIESVCKRLILESNSILTTAVVGSIATAHPKQVGKIALLFIRDPEFFALDRDRWVYDKNPVSSVLGDFGLDSFKKIHQQERVESDKLPHRKASFEDLMRQLQLGTLRDSVVEIIDGWQNALPPIDEQTEEMRWWRLLLHRNDLRNFTVREQREDGAVLITSSPPPEDIARLIQAETPNLEETHRAINLISWGMAVFEGKGNDVADKSKWREMLVQAKAVEFEISTQQSSPRESFEGGSAYVAAVCVRDHWEELNSSEKAWCRELLLMKIKEDCDCTNEFVSVQRYSSGGSRAAARVLPLLLKNTTDEKRGEVETAIAAAITHGVIEVRQYSAGSDGQYLWDIDSSLASACVAGLINLASLERSHYRAWLSIRGQSNISFQTFLLPHVKEIRDQIVSRKQLSSAAACKVSINDEFCSYVLPLISLLLVHQHKNPLAKKIFKQIICSYCRMWKRGDRLEDRRNFVNQNDVQRLIAKFIVGSDSEAAKLLWRPLAEAINEQPGEVAEFWEDIVYAQNAAPESHAFWIVWQMTADRLLKVPNLENLPSGDRHGHAKLLSGLFLDNVHWNEKARDWKPLYGHEQSFQQLFKKTGSIPSTFKAMVKMLDGIGNFLIPGALVWLAEHLNDSNEALLVGSENTLFRLACILSPLIYGQTSTLRKSMQLRQAALKILNAMVEQGSSAAFRMREFLITPAAPTC